MSDNEKLNVVINGINMEFEAWQLIRLFFSGEDEIRFISESDEFSAFSPGQLLVVEAGERGHYKSFFFSSVIDRDDLKKALAFKTNPQCVYEKKLTSDELDIYGSLFKNKKILAGSCIYEILKKVTGKNLPYGSLTGVRPVKLAIKCLEENTDKSSTIEKLIKATGMSERKASLIYDIARTEYPYVLSDKKIIHLYIGVPFCSSRCLYCSFTSYPVQRSQPMVLPYIQTLEKEILMVSEWCQSNNCKIGSVYVGGGTPTAIDEISLERLLKLLKASFDLRGVEFSVEAGRPDTITSGKLGVMLENGVTRISINPQTMNNKTLQIIGRNHTSEDIEEKFQLAGSMGFSNINMDIIAGLPGENLNMFSYTLQKIEEMAPASLTVHTMAVKRASRLFDERKTYTNASDDVVEPMIEQARTSAYKMGMRPYYLYRQKNMLANLENTGYAKPGFECLYNIHTMEERQTIIAMGAGAISKFYFPEENRIERIDNVKELSHYIDRIDEMLEKKRRMFSVYSAVRQLD